MSLHSLLQSPTLSQRRGVGLGRRGGHSIQEVPSPCQTHLLPHGAK